MRSMDIKALLKTRCLVTDGAMGIMIISGMAEPDRHRSVNTDISRKN